MKRKNKSRVFMLWFFVALSGNAYSDPLTGSSTELRGGSNYMFYDLVGCKRSDWVFNSFFNHSDIIDKQLEYMYRHGQKRLRVSVPVIDKDARNSDDPLSEDYLSRVTKFFEKIKSVGFEEVIVVAGDAYPPINEWKLWDEDSYLSRWRRIQQIRNAVRKSNISYTIDLLNEGIPTKQQELLKAYTKRLWADYVNVFGASDTLGFSIIGGDVDRLGQIQEVYAGQFPKAFDFHFYNKPFESILHASDFLKTMGLGHLPWIIGETYYNDLQESDEIRRAINMTQVDVLFLLQWPLSSSRRCVDVDVPWPKDFDQYEANGF